MIKFILDPNGFVEDVIKFPEVFLIWGSGVNLRRATCSASLVVRNAMGQLHESLEVMAKETECIAEPWRPYGSVASWYLWQFLDNAPKIAGEPHGNDPFFPYKEKSAESAEERGALSVQKLPRYVPGSGGEPGA